MDDLFDAALARMPSHAPLAERMRPRTLEEYAGQDAALGATSWLRQAIMADTIPSLMLWGPPGVGKTTLARIIAKMTKAAFVPFSAVGGSIAEVREAIRGARDRLKLSHQRTVLFVDEIHRFNKAQQDAFLPAVEDGTVILIGATTENPSFEVNGALLSRCRVVVLAALSPDALRAILVRAIADTERGIGSRHVTIDEDALDFLAHASGGDARTALNALELAASIAGDHHAITAAHIAEALQRPALLYDKGGEEHYNLISALHKSLRGNDANAALYWLLRMLESGEDPLFVARRLVRFASEDVGLADPQALVHAVTAFHATHQLGMPECDVILAQCVAYLARAPKSNALYRAVGSVRDDFRLHPRAPVPLHLRNAPTTLMKDLGYGKGYKYTPNFENPRDAAQAYLPDELAGKKYLDDV